ncbi:polyprenol monophosphomannose synthase [Patescibacteria group bacterium]
MKSLIIIPTHNEKENISELVLEILELKKKLHILVVDDNSTDGTGKVADRLSKKYPEVFTLHRKSRPALGKAYINGFKWALERDYDLIFEMDGDGSHSPQFLLKFLEKIKDFDMIIGSRFYQRKLSFVNWDIKRIFLSVLSNLYARIITGVPVSDATTGFKCFKRKVLEKINLDEVLSEGYSFQIEMNWRAHRAGFKIGEIPIIFYERRHGKSKLSASMLKEGLWVLWKMRLKQ